MKISTKLVLNFGIFFIFSLAVLAGLFFMTSHIEKSIQNNNLIEQLLDGFNDLNIVTYSYVLYPGERPRVQWDLKHTSLGNLLKRVNSEKTAVLDRMGENHREEIAMRGDRTCLRDFIPIYVNGKPFGPVMGPPGNHRAQADRRGAGGGH